MDQLGALLHQNPALCLFVSILIGTIIGRFHWKGVGLGSVVGTLVAAIVVGIIGRPELPDLLRWSFFYLFLFSIGYSVGPQFFGSLKKEALPQIVLALTVALSGLVTVVAVAAAFDLDEGLAVGVLSGGMTQSAALGTGLSAIAELPIADEVKTRLIANAPLADAITYGFGDLGLILFITWLGPRLMRADLKQEARDLEHALASQTTGVPPARVHFGLRAYRIENARLFGTTLGELERQYAQARFCVQRVRRGDSVLDITHDTTLSHGDQIVVSARRMAFQDAEREIGPELDDPKLLDVPAHSAKVVVTQSAIIGQSIAQLADDEDARGAYLESLQRGTQVLPREPWVTLERGDIAQITGSPEAVERAAARMGFVERDLSKTDLTFLAAGICAGILIGMIKFSAAGVMLGLGTAGSILVLGLIGGWARSRYPVFGAIPEPAQRLLMDIGLTVFIAAVGLHAGPHAVEAYHVSGGAFFAKLFFAGVIVTIVPQAVGALVGRYLLKLRPLLLLGGLAGAQTCTPGLTALREASESNIASLAYTVPYAIGNILLTIWGPVVVAIVHAMRS